MPENHKVAVAVLSVIGVLVIGVLAIWFFLGQLTKSSVILFETWRDGNPEIYVMNEDGTGQKNLTNHDGYDLYPSWSPDGTKIAFTTNRDGDAEIYVMNADGGNPTNLTNHPAEDNHPTWSPDSKMIAFITMRDGTGEIYIMMADGSNPARLTKFMGNNSDPVWSPDGSKIAFVHSGPTTDIYVIDVQGGEPEKLVEGISPAWSPDGSKLAFAETVNNVADIFVMDLSNGKIKNLTKHGAVDFQPVWSPDGTKIAFTTSRLLRMDVYVMNSSDGSGLKNLSNNPVHTGFTLFAWFGLGNPDWR